MNLPNTLTVARIFLVPVLVSVLLTKFEGRLVLGWPVELVAGAIFGIASLTDWLDGYLARRRKQITTLGQILDPLARVEDVIEALGEQVRGLRDATFHHRDRLGIEVLWQDASER